MRVFAFNFGVKNMLRTPSVETQAKLISETFLSVAGVLSHQATLELVAKLRGHRDYHTLLAETRKAKKTKSLPESIQIEWSIHDVFEIRPDLTKSEACQILQAMEKGYDCNEGLSWGSLEYQADKFKLREFKVELLLPDSTLISNAIATLTRDDEDICISVVLEVGSAVKQPPCTKLRFVNAKSARLPDNCFDVENDYLYIQNNEEPSEVYSALREIVDSLDSQKLLKSVSK